MDFYRVQSLVAEHAYACLRHGRMLEAATLYAWLVDRVPADMRSRLALAYALVDLGRHDQASALLAERADDEDAIVHYLMARIHTAKGDARARERFAAFRAATSVTVGLAALATRLRRLP